LLLHFRNDEYDNTPEVFVKIFSKIILRIIGYIAHFLISFVWLSDVVFVVSLDIPVCAGIVAILIDVGNVIDVGVGSERYNSKSPNMFRMIKNRSTPARGISSMPVLCRRSRLSCAYSTTP